MRNVFWAFVLIVALSCATFLIASDFGTYTITKTMDDDTTDAGPFRDSVVDTTGEVFTGDWPYATLRWEVIDADTNLANDSIEVDIQYTQDPGSGKWYSVTGLNTVITPGAGDTLGRGTADVAPRDSMGLWARGIISWYWVTDSATNLDLYGNSYKWYVIPYLDYMER